MNDWQTKKLSELLTIRHGRNQRDVESPDGDYPILGTGGEIGRSTKYLYSKPSVLIGRKGTIDKPRYMDTPFWTVDTLFYSEIQPENNPKFLYYVFNTIDWKRYNEASGVPSLSATTISSIKVATSAKPEQERIVSVLEVWDEYIEKLELKIALKEQLKKGLMQQLLTGKRRLPGFTDEWKGVALGDVSGFINGYAFLSSSYVEKGVFKIITIANVQDGALQSASAKTISILPSNISDQQILDKGDLLISMTGNVGRTCRVNIENGLLNQRVGKIVPRPEINKDFLYFRLQSRHFLAKMIELAQGGAQDNLSSKDIRRYHIKLPPQGEQLKIAEILNTLEAELSSLSLKKEVTVRQRKYLLKNLITGTIRTPEDLKPLVQPEVQS